MPYLVSGRKQWHHDFVDTWEEIFFNRGSYIECGIFRKLTTELTEEDKCVVDCYSEIPDEWVWD